MRARSRRRQSSRVARGSAFPTVILVAALSSGCTSVEDVAGEGGSFVESSLDDDALAVWIEHCDELYTEPRTVEKVTASFKFALGSLTSRDGHAAAWRVLRASAWLARNHPERERRLEHGRRGIAVGLEALGRGTSESARTHYQLALTMGAFCEVKGTCDTAFVRRMRNHAKTAQADDPGVDHCGPGRFLGKLIVETLDYPGYSLGTLEEALELLSTAVHGCPDFAENGLFLAEALIEDGDDEEAGRALRCVIASRAPADHTVEHATWVKRARELLEEL